MLLVVALVALLDMLFDMVLVALLDVLLDVMLVALLDVLFVPHLLSGRAFLVFSRLATKNLQ